MDTIPDISLLGRWLHSWVQPNGAIHGFHNHSVWGGNPYRYLDMTAGHSTFASPLLPALALACQQQPDDRGKALIETLLNFQTSRFQEDGQFAHIGFQVGEILKHGLIHNVVPDVSLSYTALLLKDQLDSGLLAKIDQAVRKNLAACDQIYGERPRNGSEGKGGSSCSNQDYCRLWARLLHMEAYAHEEWDDTTRESLHFMIENFHVVGLPDSSASGSWRVVPERRYVEPAEYYGLMIVPLVLGYQRYRDERFLKEAVQLARHVTRGSWQDGQGWRRLHRYFQRDGDRWIRVKEPMLIGGMGITLYSIQCLQNLNPEKEFDSFLKDMDATYHAYQGPGGFFLGASGWYKECDIIPSSAWQSHDLLHLIHRHGLPEGFWDRLFSKSQGVQVVLGHNTYWLEDGEHWALRGYITMEDADLIGRKDEPQFYRQYARWIQDADHAPESFESCDPPVFQRIDDAILYYEGKSDLHILNASPWPYRGPALTTKQPFISS